MPTIIKTQLNVLGDRCAKFSRWVVGIRCRSLRLLTCTSSAPYFGVGHLFRLSPGCLRLGEPPSGRFETASHGVMSEAGKYMKTMVKRMVIWMYFRDLLSLTAGWLGF